MLSSGRAYGAPGAFGELALGLWRWLDCGVVCVGNITRLLLVGGTSTVCGGVSDGPAIGAPVFS